jgi:hypothetical protein
MTSKDDSLYDVKYKKSKNNRDCLGPCYKPEKWIIHPVSLSYITNKAKPFCPVMPYEYYNPITDKSAIMTIDECYRADDEQDINVKLIELNMLMPKIDFDCSQFLKIYYNIYSFENGINYIINNMNSPYYTKIRILECAWKIYGNNKAVITDNLITIYLSIIKKRWIKLIYNSLSKYIKVESNKIFFTKKATSKDNKYKVQKINYLFDKLINKNNLYNILEEYIEDHKDKWARVLNHNLNILEYMIDYFENKILNSI